MSRVDVVTLCVVLSLPTLGFAFILWDLISLARKVRAEMPALRAAGWTFSPYKGSRELGKSFGRAVPFAGRSGSLSMVLRGTVRGYPVLAFRQLRRVTSSTSGAHNWRSVVVLELDRPLPRLLVCGEFDFRRGLSGFPPGPPARMFRADVPGPAEGWNLMGHSPAVAEAVLTGPAVRLLWGETFLQVRIDGHAVIGWVLGRYAEKRGPNEMVALAERLVAFVEQIPAWVWDEGARVQDPHPGPSAKTPA